MVVGIFTGTVTDKRLTSKKMQAFRRVAKWVELLYYSC
jgi:hypothetical protein